MFEIGASLREARERRKLSYEQAESETKIRAKYIRCLEEEEFDVLPSGTYVRGFLRTYAEYLGLQGQLYVDEYTSRFGTIHDEVAFARRRVDRAPPRRESSNVILVALAGIVAVTVLFIVAWKLGAPQSTPSPPPAVDTAHLKQPPGKPAATVVKHKAAVSKNVNLMVRASRGKSYLSISGRADGGGQLLYEGVLTRDHATRWLKSRTGFLITDAGIKGNVDLVVNGRSFRLQGDPPWRVTRTGVVSLKPATMTG